MSIGGSRTLSLEVRKRPGTWDAGLIFDDAKAVLLAESKNAIAKRNYVTLSHCYLCLIQLANGGRVSESLDMLYSWCEGSDEGRIRVRKKVRFKGVEPDRLREKLKKAPTRLMIVPPELNPVFRSQILRALPPKDDEKKRASRIRTLDDWLRRRWSISSHAFRYAFENRVKSLDVPIPAIAGMTGQTFNVVQHYFRQQSDEEILRNLVRGGEPRQEPTSTSSDRPSSSPEDEILLAHRATITAPSTPVALQAPLPPQIQPPSLIAPAQAQTAEAPKLTRLELMRKFAEERGATI